MCLSELFIFFPLFCVAFNAQHTTLLERNIFNLVCNEAFALINWSKRASTMLIGATVCYSNWQPLSALSCWMYSIFSVRSREPDSSFRPLQLQMLRVLERSCARLPTTPSPSTGRLMMNSRWCPTSSSTPSSPDSLTLPVSVWKGIHSLLWIFFK